MEDDNTNSLLHFDICRRLVIPAPMGLAIERLVEGKCTELQFSYLTPPGLIERCVYCTRQVATCVLPSGTEYHAEIEIDDHLVVRAVLTTPHTCAESKLEENTETYDLEDGE